MSPMPGLPEKIAASLVTSLLKASAGFVRKRLSESDARKALEAAVASALAEALEGQELRDRDEDWAHFGSFIENFFKCEEAAFELAQLLDPRPDQVPDFSTLAHEFRIAGYVPEDLPGFDLDEFLRAFFSAFYAAAGTQEPLRAGIDLKLLGTQLQQLGVAVAELRRTADAGERTADSLERIELVIERFVAGKSEGEDLRRIVEAARAEGFLAAYRTFEDLGSGLLKAGVDLGVDARGVLEIMPCGSEASRALPPARLEAVRLLAGELRSAVLDHAPSEDELNALEARYRQHIIRWFESLTFRGMMRTPKPIVLPLEEVYVELRVVAEVPEVADTFSVEERRLLLEIDERDESKRRELMSQLDAFRRERWSRTIPERKSIAEALHQRDRRAFVILGDPGSGKTTLLHFLALVYARGPETAAQRLSIDLAEADRLPIFVPLAAFDDMLRESQREGRSLTLGEFLPRYYDRRRGLPGLEPLFRRAFDSGRALVLLDGLDEVLDVGTRTYVAQQAGALIGDLAGVRFAVSSRFVGYREAPLNLPTLSVLDFGTPEIETFVRRWAHAFEKWAANGFESPELLRRAQKLETGLLEDVKSNESVRRLAANPLMLTMLALLRRQVGRLPHRRVQLYESYIGTLLENWVDARSEGARERSVEILDQHQAESILIPLAFWLQQEKPSGTAGRVEIRNKLVEICLRERGDDPERAERVAVREAEAQADRFLQEMRQMAGLIIERGHDAFGFLHLTFQEYFVGRALAQLKDEERWGAIRPNLHDPRWREPILLCAGRLGVVENRRAQVTQLVQNILDNDDPTEADLHRNLLSALSIVCDDVNLEPALVTELVERAIAQLSAPVDSFARELLRLLGQLMANGAASCEKCLAAVEEVERIQFQEIAIEEWGRFVSVQKIEVWLRKQLESTVTWFARPALEALALQIGEDPVLRQKAISLSVTMGIGPAAAQALARIAQSNSEVREVFLARKGSEAPIERLSAIRVLSGLVKSDAEVRRIFLERLEDPYPDVRKASAGGLLSLAGEESSVRRALLKVATGSAGAGAHAEAIEWLASLIDNEADVRQVVLDGLKHSDWAVQCAAVRAAPENLGDVREALPRVLDLLAKRWNQTGLMDALKGWVPEVPEIQEVFMERLGEQDWRVREVACQGLADVGSVSPENLKNALRSQDTLEASRLLRECVSGAKCNAEKWVTFCRANLEHSDPDIREAAVTALAGLVGTVEEIRRAVLERLADSDLHVRASALTAVSGIVGTDEEARHSVLERLADRSVYVRQFALSALSGIVGTDGEARRAVLKRLAEDEFARNSALSALSGIVGTDEEARQAVLEGLADRDKYVRQSALSASSGIVGTDERVRRAVLERLSDKDKYVRRSALSALSGIVGTDEEARRAVLERLREKDEDLRDAALSALSGIVGTDEQIRRATLEFLKDTRWNMRDMRRQAVESLSHLLKESEIRQAILQAMEDRDFSVRLQAVGAVAQWKEEALFESLKDGLRDWLGMEGDSLDPYPHRLRSVRAQLAKLFGAQLSTDSPLLGKFLEMLRDPRWSARLGAALALLAWPGGPPEECITQVIAALEDRRGLEAYPAQLTAASYLINRNDTGAEAIELCLHALDYGTKPWEGSHSSRAVRQQAALVLGKLEPISYDDRIYDKLLHVLRNDEDSSVRDAAYGTLVRLARMRDQQAVVA